MTRFLVIGDTHFKRTDLHLADLYISKCVELATTTKPNFIILLGDILDNHDEAYSQCFNKACSLIELLSKIAYTIVLVGNHDYINQSQFLTTNHFFNPLKKWKNVKIVDDVFGFEDSVGRNYLAVPYVPKGRFSEAIDEYDLDDVECIFAHQEFKGCKMGAVISNDGDEWLEDAPLVISGHIHDTQQPQPNIFYPGSSFQHGWNDGPDKKVCLYSISDSGEINIEKLSLKMPVKRTVKLSVAELSSFNFTPDVEWRIKLSVTQDEMKALKKTDAFKSLVAQSIRIENDVVKSVGSVNEKKILTYTSVFNELLDRETEDVKKMYQKIFA
jgi:DNA repair exonuclease SbcCD nuclease subunit